MLRVVSLTTAAVMILLLMTPAQAQQQDDLDQLNRHISELHKAGKYAEAIPIAEHYVEAARKEYGEEHDAFATSIAWLGILYQAQRRFDEAEPLLKRSLAVREKAPGPNHLDVATSLDNLARLYQEQGPGLTPCRSTSAHSRSAKRDWALITPMLRPRSTISPTSTQSYIAIKWAVILPRRRRSTNGL